MKFSTLDADLAIHQKLEDEPNDVGGLSARELKEKFDEAGLTIQSYLNDTHLPQVGEALAETLEAAKVYADRKVVAVGAGDMAGAVYDPRGLGEDVYQYAHDEAVRVLGDAARFGCVALGGAAGSVTDAGSLPIAFTSGYLDPRGMWDPEHCWFTAPEGSRWMAVTVGVKWARELFASCGVQVYVNGILAGEAAGPEENDGKVHGDTVTIPAAVRGGDVVSVRLSCRTSAGNRAYVSARSMRCEIIV